MACIVAGVFDGDVEALLGMVSDRSIDQFVREQILRAATFLTWNGSIRHDRMRRLLVAFVEDQLAEDEDQAWYGWQQAIALLGMRELAPLVHRAIDEGRIPDWMLVRREFDDTLTDAERRPEDATRFKDVNLGYIDDVADALAWTDYDDATDQLSDEDLDTEWIPTEPVRNPFRNVGRNDPCPCGSGKKYKKCCLADQS